MAASEVQVKSAASTSAVASLSLTMTSSTTSGNFIWLDAAFQKAGGIAGVTFTITDTFTNTWSNSSAPQTSTANAESAIWTAANISGGASHQFTVTPSASTFITFAVHEWSGITTSSPVDSNHSGTGTGTAASSGTIPVNFSNDCLFACTDQDSLATVTISAGTGTLDISLMNNASIQSLADSYQTGVNASQAATFTYGSSVTWSVNGISVKTPAVTRQQTLTLLGCGI